MPSKFDIAVVGATGVVGESMLEILAEREFPVGKVYALASERSIGKTVTFGNRELEVEDLADFDFSKVQLGLFSAGGSISAEYAPKAAAAGCVVVDNTSHFRYDDDIPLVVPEVNPEAIADYTNRGIIANPNCSTIQMVVALAPLHRKYKIKRLVISTYQSITGTGVKAVQQLENEYEGIQGEMAYPYPIHRNALPHCDVFEANGYTKEEMKLVRETQKILNDKTIAVTATAVRIPVVGGHSESINVEFENEFDLSEVKQMLNETDGVVVQDDLENNSYPMPRFAEGKDEVFVGRLRRDESQPQTLNMWVVSDNLRKGAATNTVQIAEYLAKHQLVSA